MIGCARALLNIAVAVMGQSLTVLSLEALPLGLLRSLSLLELSTKRIPVIRVCAGDTPVLALLAGLLVHPLVR